MDLWTFIIIIVLICAFKDVIKKKSRVSGFDKIETDIEQAIYDLKKRLYELEMQSGCKDIEKRLQALETIIVDSDYNLNMKFKKAFGD